MSRKMNAGLYFVVLLSSHFAVKTEASFRSRHILNSVYWNFFVGRKMDAWTTKIDQNEVLEKSSVKGGY